MRKSGLFVLVCVVTVLFLYAWAYAKYPGDKDNNPPGPEGGAGTNWENPPGPKGGPGASPDVAVPVSQKASDVIVADESLSQKAVVIKPWERAADKNNDGIVDAVEADQWQKGHPVMKDKSEVDTGWERRADLNNDGVVEQTEVDRWKERPVDKDNNPPGPEGGAGTNWENPPGPKGGSGASPDK